MKLALQAQQHMALLTPVIRQVARRILDHTDANVTKTQRPPVGDTGLARVRCRLYLRPVRDREWKSWDSHSCSIIPFEARRSLFDASQAGRRFSPSWLLLRCPVSGHCMRDDLPEAGPMADAVEFADIISGNIPDLTDHQGIVTFSQRVNVPVGPSGPSSATRTTSREPSSTDAVPSKPLRFVLVKPGETKLTLIPVDSSSTIIAKVTALRAALDAG
jgi:hypothetical protein